LHCTKCRCRSTTPNAKLDIASSNASNPSNTDGVLVPKINVFPATNPTALQQGMLVYLTTAVGIKLPGFYYWDNNTITWVGIQSTSTSTTANAWNTLGNSSNIDGTHFIGNVDNVPLNFRVNNLTAGRVDHLLFNAFYGDRAGKSNSIGFNNNAIGSQALTLNTTGNSNNAIGFASMYNNVSGSNNTALGSSASYTNTSGKANTAVGKSSLYFNTADSTTAVGFFALNNNTIGKYNTALGTASLFSNTIGARNTGVGFSSLLNNTTGSFNTALGFNSLTANNTGAFNTATGFASLPANTTGGFNTAMALEHFITIQPAQEIQPLVQMLCYKILQGIIIPQMDFLHCLIIQQEVKI
jgi:trimeric autotransporter adhesin